MRFKSEDEGSLRGKLRAIAAAPEQIRGMRGSAREVFEEWYRRTTPMRVVPEVVGRMLAGQTARGGA